MWKVNAHSIDRDGEPLFDRLSMEGEFEVDFEPASIELQVPDL